MNKEQKFISEAGAIMLELIAVLSLMGLMGVMLFRQIYKRNEELHNIQMASEIRVVKEGFSAWIQANRADLPSLCSPSADHGDVVYCNVSAQAGSVQNFLPDGYLDGGANALSANYNLFLVAFYRGNDADDILTYYGVVVPKVDILPDTGDTTVWNFRRAARIAMLIGIDGGAYGPGFTGDNISGSMGTWSLSRESGGVYLWGVAGENSPPVYVAITGIDVFQPEIELPDLKLGIPDDWDAAFRDATAYGKFSVGTDSDCYIKHPTRQADVAADGTVMFPRDTVNDPLSAGSNCIPAFYVEQGTSAGNAASAGNVYVTNDLRVGHSYTGADAGKSAMRFDKNGMIVFEKAEVVDPQNAASEINYVLDPQYTSVMNDIKIMSRGGARLSDVLPNYILKEVKLISNGSDTVTITPNYCPTGYKYAIVVDPISQRVDKGKLETDANGATGSVVSSGGGDSVVTDVKPLDVYIGTNSSCAVSTNTVSTEALPNSNTDMYICLGSYSSGTFTKDTLAKAHVYVYCVFDKSESAFSNLPEKKRGATMTGGEVSSARTEEECRAYGGFWDSTADPKCASQAAANIP